MAAVAAAALLAITCGPAAAKGPESPVPSQAYAYDGDLVDFPPPPSGISITGSEPPNDILVRFESATHFLVSDLASGIVPGEPGIGRIPCESVDPEKVRCDHLGPEVGVSLHEAEDRLKVLLPVDVNASGGSGRDRITTGSGDDRLQGDGGADRLVANTGNDDLYANPGRDSAYGGRGGDLLDMADGDRDRAIRCGPGFDTAIVDVRIDPEPRGCERIKVRPLER